MNRIKAAFTKMRVEEIIREIPEEDLTLKI